MAMAHISSSRCRSPVMARSRLRSVRLAIMRTLLRRELSASSKVPRMCLGAIIETGSSEAAGDVFLSLPLAGIGENLSRVIKLDEAAEIKEGGMIGAASGLLHVVGDD